MKRPIIDDKIREKFNTGLTETSDVFLGKLNELLLEKAVDYKYRLEITAPIKTIIEGDFKTVFAERIKADILYGKIDYKLEIL